MAFQKPAELDTEEFSEEQPVADTSSSTLSDSSSTLVLPLPSELHRTAHSVLDAQLEALSLGQDGLASTLLAQKGTELELLEEGGENVGESLLALSLHSEFTMFKMKKGPNSLIGTGSSIASASDHEVSSSDFESDSGIENFHTELPSPEAGAKGPGERKKGGEHFPQSHSDDSNVTQVCVMTADQSEAGEGSCDQSPEEEECPVTRSLDTLRIDSFIKCLDERVDVCALTEEAIQLLRQIPEGYIPLPHQVGGHRHVDGKLGFLRRVGQNDILFKPVPSPKGPREVLFYKSVFKSHYEDIPKEILSLKELIPNYYGTHDIVDRAGQVHKYIKLEDIVSRFRKPCIMDVKVGRRVWDDFAEQDKIDREKRKYPPQEIIGFRIIGMRVYRSATDDYVYYNKEYGRSVSVSGALEALKNFFVDGDTNRYDVLGPILERLYYFLRWMEQQKLFKLFATSLLIVYEGDTNRPIRKPKDLLEIRLVDFAHAYERSPNDSCEPDFNTLFGLQNFVKYLEQLNVVDSRI